MGWPIPWRVWVGGRYLGKIGVSEGKLFILLLFSFFGSVPGIFIFLFNL